MPQITDYLSNGLSQKQLLTIHYLVYENMPKYKIAELLKFDVKSISRWMKEPVFRAAYDAANFTYYAELSTAAIEVIKTLMLDSTTPANTRLNAAKDILSRAGYDAPKKIENTNKDIVVELIVDESNDKK